MAYSTHSVLVVDTQNFKQLKQQDDLVDWEKPVEVIARILASPWHPTNEAQELGFMKVF